MKNRGVFAMWAIGALVVFLVPASADAQDRRVHVNFGGGPTMIFDTLGDGFSTGWGPAIGVTFDINDRTAFQLEYAYRRFSLKDDLDSAAGSYDANHRTSQLDFNFIANLAARESRVRPFLVVGPGAYERQVEITEYVGSGIVCDPWLYLCGDYPVEVVLGSRGGWDMGFNVGGGIGFKFNDDAEFYVEMRYHYVWGPETEPTVMPVSTSGRQKVNGQYFPITFGLRF
jgi:opacity protein-like surface antigen